MYKQQPPRARSRRSSWPGVFRPALLALVTYALGLIPFYFLTPVHQTVPGLLNRSTTPALQVIASPTPDASPPAPTPTVSLARSVNLVPVTAVATVETATAPPATATVQPTFTPVPDPRYAVLLLGYGGANHDGAYLTDSMTVVIVDPVHKTLTLLALPRDSWVPMRFDGDTAVYNKVNTAYAFAKDPNLYPERLAKYTGPQGAGIFTTDTVASLLGIPITSYVGLDFDGFRQAINAVGGIDVNVPDTFTVRYPANDDPSVNASWITVRFHQGWEHMNGERAIEFARARETLDNSNEGTDFARSERQHQIIEAFKSRVLAPGGIIHLPQLLNIAAHHVDTNYALPAVTQLSQLVLSWKDVRVFQTAITTDNYLEPATGQDDSYLLVPSSADHSWEQVQGFVQHLWSDPEVGTAMASTRVSVINASATSGLATHVSELLQARGYEVEIPSSGPEREQSRLIDRTGGKAAALLAQLPKDLGVGPLDVVSGEVSDPPEIDLQLGNDLTQLSDANLPVSSAPSSRAGVIRFGSWSPDLQPTSTPTRVVSKARPPVTASVPAASPTRAAVQPDSTPTVDNAVSSGTVTMPSLVGLPPPEAKLLASNLGLSVVRIQYVTANQVPDKTAFLRVAVGQVFSQFPYPDSSVPHGTKVYLSVRKE